MAQKLDAKTREKLGSLGASRERERQFLVINGREGLNFGVAGSLGRFQKKFWPTPVTLTVENLADS